jgi:hypothetical protein
VCVYVWICIYIYIYIYIYKNFVATCFGRNRPPTGKTEYQKVLRRIKAAVTYFYLFGSHIKTTVRLSKVIQIIYYCFCAF